MADSLRPRQAQTSAAESQSTLSSPSPEYYTSSAISSSYYTSVAITPSDTTSSRATSSGTTPLGTTPSPSASPTVTTAKTASSSVSQHTQTATNHPSSGHGVSSGALAGAVVGSIAGTAIIALLAAWLFFRSRRDPPRRASNLQSPDRQGVELAKSSATVQTRPIPASFAAGAEQSLSLDLAPFIPPPADDQTVSSRIQILFDHISLHVDNYYAPDSGDSAQPHAPEIQEVVRYNSPFISGPLAATLANRRVRRAALTHVLARTLLEAIQAGGLLYPPFQDTHEGDIARLSAGAAIASDNAAFAWRLLTAHLHADYLDTSSPAAQRNIAALAGDFSRTFAAFHNPQFSDPDVRRHLRSVVKEAADLGVWLFAQPCSFEFVWDAPSRSIAILPAVVKVSDERGQRLATPRKVVEEATAQI
ncbi:uncharacterized protein BO72DRAFT_446694 [Aspergillus fijiensis CBS 313.89]|uniref:Uncharacterized protein n=1 Tax=Aspergillus fijiensis CBS 313.89 TaxID=1448319 RepID=A0A8G1RY44_9EURO|nr:uncharacterized protein BO72DRAFT_446694 [Aspergillus fijiensis CBS 313.89]RAK78936.1 hypothetical protein BO72DRAFT_446694 [Aspergillus fijiensis CBS 313.89]